MISLDFSLLSTLHPARCYGTEVGVVKSQSPFNLRIGLEAKNQNKTKQKQNHPCFLLRRVRGNRDSAAEYKSAEK
jgi:hypothetical protein